MSPGALRGLARSLHDRGVGGIGRLFGGWEGTEFRDGLCLGSKGCLAKLFVRSVVILALSQQKLQHSL